VTGDTPTEASGLVVRRGEQGWQVGDEQAADLTSAMVLADLLAAELGTPAPPPASPPRSEPVSEEGEAARLAVTVAQLEHALTARPRQAFDLLRNVARSGGRRVIEIAETVVDSTSNPLLTLPEELARKQPAPRKRGRSPRHARAASERLARPAP
jgi:hypothetical protein